ncbi:MAG TPA: hypothetical protein VG387_17985 [Rhizomicrobium sp.]|nr:hypothetical protein [Rhizomicrobium sp.]
MKRIAQAIAWAGVVMATSALAPAFAMDAGCKAYSAALHALFYMPYHKHTTTPGRSGGAFTSDDIVVGGKQYIYVPARGPIPAAKSVTPFDGPEAALVYDRDFGGLPLICKRVGRETVNGEAADIYVVSSDVTFATRLWIGQKSGRLLKDESPSESGVPIRTVFTYDNIKAPW